MNIDDQVARFWAETIPGWVGAVCDEQHGGIFTRLSADGLPVQSDPKLTLVQARTMFTLAHLERSGHGAPAIRQAAENARQYLMGRLCHPRGGWRMAVSRDGSADGVGADGARDCYDHAFVLLAAATWGKIEPSASGKTEEIWQVIETLFAQGDGALIDDDRTPPSLPRRQNPHMHMFEACLFAWEASGQDIWRQRAEALLDIFEHHLFDPATGTLREFLSPELGPLDTPQGAIREPGHHYEWVWLLNRYAGLGGTRGIAAARDALLTFATAHGQARSGPMAGAVLDEVDPAGTVLSATHLLWPQTEAIKAHLSEYERTGDAAHRATARALAELMFRHYIGQGGRFWINQRDTRAQITQPDAPSRLLYHIAVALTEGERLDAWKSPGV